MAFSLKIKIPAILVWRLDYLGLFGIRKHNNRKMQNKTSIKEVLPVLPFSEYGSLLLMLEKKNLYQSLLPSKQHNLDNKHKLNKTTCMLGYEYGCMTIDTHTCEGQS